MDLVITMRTLLIVIFASLLSQGCSTMPAIIDSSLQNQRDLPSHQANNSGFNADEAKQLLEFYIERNNQDDRNKHENKGNPELAITT